ncbi:TPA: EpsG family protein, partial [Aeromonas salmonicida]|nr:EpsG family protein [Aeromonas salmonicida]
MENTGSVDCMAYFIFLNIFFIVTFFHRKKQVIEIFLFLLVLFFTAFSYKNGWDLNTYESWFLYINKYGLSGLVYIYEQEGIEGGYLFFNYIVSLFSSYFEIFVFIFGLLTCLLYYVGCRRLGLNFGLLILVFFCSSYTRLELSTLRQGIAVAIF